VTRIKEFADLYNPNGDYASRCCICYPGGGKSEHSSALGVHLFLDRLRATNFFGVIAAE